MQKSKRPQQPEDDRNEWIAKTTDDRALGWWLAPQPHTCADNEFTIEEHLRVQRQIERRAHCLWTNHGDDSNAINDWLQAECEVLAAFMESRMRAAGGTQTKTNRAYAWPAQDAPRLHWFRMECIPVRQSRL